MSGKLKNKPVNAVIAAVFAVLATVSVVLYYLPAFAYFKDDAADRIFSEAIIRACVAGFLIALCFYSGERETLSAKTVGKKSVLAVAPCFLVAIVNFPIFALATGGAKITRTDLIWLVAVNCVLIAVVEEVFFRGILQNYFAERLKDKKHSIILTVLITSAAFAAWHLVNLFTGAGVGQTLLQVVYTFLVGAMLSFIVIESKNIWLCVVVHAIFDLGGAIPTIGTGNFQDTAFWIMTVSVGVAVGAYVTFSIWRKSKCEMQNFE